ncbi:Uncharacterised protein [uncultured Clostridium sp.]|nr:Uncharacterised protein [uncultured Clostridium sp.]
MMVGKGRGENLFENGLRMKRMKVYIDRGKRKGYDEKSEI